MVYIFLANGFEEIEALTVVDLLRRAQIDIKMVSIDGNETVTSSHSVTVKSDMSIADVNWDAADMLVLPGGMPGTNNLAECDELMSHVKDFAVGGKYIAAICAAPALTFGESGLLNGKKATCYPGMEEHMHGACAVTDEVVADGNVITSRGMGTAIPFGLKIIETLKGEAVSKQIGDAIVYRQ